MTIQGGFGAELDITTSGLTAVTHVTDMPFPEFEKVLADVTAHDSPSGYQEWIDTGKRKVNSFEVTIEWDKSDTTHAAIQTAFDATAAVVMRLKNPKGNEVINFSGHIQKMGRTSEQEKAYECKVTIQPTGVASIASAAT